MTVEKQTELLGKLKPILQETTDKLEEALQTKELEIVFCIAYHAEGQETGQLAVLSLPPDPIMACEILSIALLKLSAAALPREPATGEKTLLQ